MILDTTYAVKEKTTKGGSSRDFKSGTKVYLSFWAFFKWFKQFPFFHIIQMELFWSIQVLTNAWDMMCRNEPFFSLYFSPPPSNMLLFLSPSHCLLRHFLSCLPKHLQNFPLFAPTGTPIKYIAFLASPSALLSTGLARKGESLGLNRRQLSIVFLPLLHMVSSRILPWSVQTRRYHLSGQQSLKAMSWNWTRQKRVFMGSTW